MDILTLSVSVLPDIYIEQGTTSLALADKPMYDSMLVKMNFILVVEIPLELQ